MLTLWRPLLKTFLNNQSEGELWKEIWKRPLISAMFLLHVEIDWMHCHLFQILLSCKLYFFLQCTLFPIRIYLKIIFLIRFIENIRPTYEQTVFQLWMCCKQLFHWLISTTNDSFIHTFYLNFKISNAFEFKMSFEFKSFILEGRKHYIIELGRTYPIPISMRLN